MNRTALYNAVLDNFENNYLWWGRQAVKAILRALASQRIQELMMPPYRVRTHILLYAPPGWVKSCFLTLTMLFAGPQNCHELSKVSEPFLRGSTIGRGKNMEFVPPYVIQFPVFYTPEIGRLTNWKDIDMVQTWLELLEDGVFSTGLLKVASLSTKKRENAEKKYERHGLTFTGPGSFAYVCRFVHLSATYNSKYLGDEAMNSRYEIVTPNGDLNGNLAGDMCEKDPILPDVNLIKEFTKTLFEEEHKLDSMEVNVPAELRDVRDVSPRVYRNVKSYVLSRRWWGLKTTKEEILLYAKEMMKSHRRTDRIEDQILLFVEDQGEATAEDILKFTKELGHSRSWIYKTLKNLERNGAVQIQRDPNDMRRKLYKPV